MWVFTGSVVSDGIDGWIQVYLYDTHTHGVVRGSDKPYFTRRRDFYIDVSDV